MRCIALKVDVDTWRGTREGVPRLVELLQRHGAGATFLFSLGPDRTGRAIRRVLRPGFLAKVNRTSVLGHYGLRTLLYGTLLPAPDIGEREAALMRHVRDAGFEVGIHSWDHVGWQDNVVRRGEDWTRREMGRAVQRFTEVFGTPPRTHGAAGWQMNEAAYALEREFGLAYASDVRGTHPFQPVDERGAEWGVPQLPTTLPTLDELIGVDGLDAGNVHRHLLAATAHAAHAVQPVQPVQRNHPGRCHVYTLHAELEGMRLLVVLERLLEGWKGQGYRLVSMGSWFDTLDAGRLPRHRVTLGQVPGRSGMLAVQAEEVRMGEVAPQRVPA